MENLDDTYWDYSYDARAAVQVNSVNALRQDKHFYKGVSVNNYTQPVYQPVTVTVSNSAGQGWGSLWFFYRLEAGATLDKMKSLIVASTLMLGINRSGGTFKRHFFHRAN